MPIRTPLSSASPLDRSGLWSPKDENQTSWSGGIDVRHIIDPLKKQIHEAEDEIEAIECKIRFADLKTTYPDEYNAMRCEQEQHRQQILKSNVSIDDQVASGKGAESSETLDS